ncbi:ATP-binding SpoIIE family protein phosphatase [Streptomyces sp. NPDC005708]|uniref:ATP-binding SpoIIE family protein phosphatase n=1 Tax=Streptomyces sp. NPDC005708 TaxID=3154564 RepID=UPI0033E751FF
MASVRLSRWVIALLIAYIGLITVIQIETAGNGLVRWSGYSVLTPLTAAALLPVRRTLIVGVPAVAAVVGTYGFEIHEASAGGRVVAISAVVLSFGLSPVICRMRLSRERYRRHAAVRNQLAFLSSAGRRIGKVRPLDMTHTARQAAEVAVPRFADFAAVDLSDTVLRGREPSPELLRGPFSLRCVAERSVSADRPHRTLNRETGPDFPEVAAPLRLSANVRPARAYRLSEDEVAHWLGLNPFPATPGRRSRVHSAIVAPLCSCRGAVLGAMVFIRHQRPEPFDTDDLVIAEEIAMRTAVYVDNALRHACAHGMARSLRRSLLPRHLPQLAAVEAAGRHLAADSPHAGLDTAWFDVIPLSSARVALVVGKVPGHGVRTFATAAQLRAAVRALADLDLPPDELLAHLGDVLMSLPAKGARTPHGQPVAAVGGTADDLRASCLYAVYDPVSRRCALAGSGHPPPAVVTPDGGVETVDLPPGPGLGLGGLPFEAVEMDLAEGSLLALSTDSLVGSCHQHPAGSRALREILEPGRPALDVMCESLLATLLDHRPHDDAALLLVRTRTLDAGSVATWALPSSLSAVPDARAYISGQLAAWGLEDGACGSDLVVSELVTNAVRHAAPPVQLRVIRQENSLIYEVSDGSSTPPRQRRSQAYDECGRGLFLVSELTERWGVRHGPDGKTVWAEQACAPASSDHRRL